MVYVILVYTNFWSCISYRNFIFNWLVQKEKDKRRVTGVGITLPEMSNPSTRLRVNQSQQLFSLA